MRTAYDVLGVSREADSDAIKRAFQARAKILHPDINKSSTATVEFQELNKAFETLKDENKRRDHDHQILKIVTKDVPDDMFDDILTPKKKKKKKKNKRPVDEKPEPARMPVQQSVAQTIYHIHQFVQPQQQVCQQPAANPYYQQQPPQYDPRRGQADWHGIPDGYGSDDSCGGVF